MLTKNIDDMIYSSWYIECDRLKLVIMGHFSPSTPLKPKKSEFWKNEKNCWRYHHMYLKATSYEVHHFVSLGHFLPFDSPNNPKNQKLEKMKKTPGDIIILQLCTTNKNHVMYVYWDINENMYASWDMECDFGHMECYFGPFFALLPLPPSKKPENQNFEKMKKKTWRYHHFTQVYHKWQSYYVWFLRSEAQQTEFLVILRHFLQCYPTKKPKNQNFVKMKKTPGDITILHMRT